MEDDVVHDRMFKNKEISKSQVHTTVTVTYCAKKHAVVLKTKAKQCTNTLVATDSKPLEVEKAPLCSRCKA